MLYKHLYKQVSILVLMDITLIPGKTRTMLEYIQCFNPCFNGYYTYTIGELKIGYSKILVSILVLMDITLIPFIKSVIFSLISCFNPCFNGYYTYTVHEWHSTSPPFSSFNPCFNGYYTYTYY